MQLHRVVPFFDLLFREAAPVVELNDVCAPLVQVGHDKTDAWEQLALLPFDLGYYATRLMPRFRLVLEAVIKHFGFIRRATHETPQKMLAFPLQNSIGFDANGVAMALFLQQTVQRRIGNRRITAKELGIFKWRYRSITGSNTRRQNFALA